MGNTPYPPFNPAPASVGHPEYVSAGLDKSRSFPASSTRRLVIETTYDRALTSHANRNSRHSLDTPGPYPPPMCTMEH